ncbi:hypothetical protein FB451DRAFT_1175068 [Mycena latifolia]|nr:hypothetical protein FB451DRAFT_1175068 [Mycena latifolia]
MSTLQVDLADGKGQTWLANKGHRPEVRTGSNRFSEVQQILEFFEPRTGPGVRFRFASGSEPDRGNTSCIATALGALISSRVKGGSGEDGRGKREEERCDTTRSTSPKVFKPGKASSFQGLFQPWTSSRGYPTPCLSSKGTLKTYPSPIKVGRAAFKSRARRSPPQSHLLLRPPPRSLAPHPSSSNAQISFLDPPLPRSYLSVAEAGVVNGWERHRPIVSGLYLESMRAASTPARYAAALSTSALPPPSRVLSRVSARCLRRWRSAESPDLARQVHLHFFLPRFPTTLTQVLIGSHRVNEQGAWSSSILIHTLLPSCTATRPTQPHRRSLYRNCHQAISSLPSPSFGPACSARDGSGEGSATKVAQPSALDSFPKVLKLLRRAKGRRTLVFLGLRLRWCATHATPTSHRVPTWLNAETAAARPRQALSFPIPCGTSTRIPSTLATIVVARRAINVGRR